MLIFLLVIIILACLILAFFVLIQDSKGGGLASNFASSNQIMGVRKTTDFLEKATWSLAAGIMILCLAYAFITK
ncbi:MAG TPA: preprotein translocase subunit SecG, partial [Bacteroidales bacterium]|nr:preprotein translocase subunit SecG [Bacteroidales bacterium]